MSFEQFIGALKKFYREYKSTIPLLIGGSLSIQDYYVSLAVITSEERKAKEGELKQPDLRPTTYETIFQSKEPVRLEKLFERGELKNAPKKRVLIQGSAGIGKSTLCQNIAYQWAQEKAWLRRFKAVFWLKLRDLTGERYPANTDYTVYQVIERECGFKSGQIENLLKDPEFRANCLLILDGYDEFSDRGLQFKPEEGAPLASLVEAFQKAFHHIIITTRPQEVANFEKEANLEILGFEETGIREYINKFFRSKESSKEGEKNEGKQALENQLQNPLVRSLCHIPINLEIFCSLAFKGKTFPVDRSLGIAQMYDRLTDWLMKRFLKLQFDYEADALEHPCPQQDENVVTIAQNLQELAWNGIEWNKIYFDIEDFEVKEILFKNVHQITKVRKLGPFRINENGEGQFIHLTFQEFFAAKYLARLLEKWQGEAKKIIQEKKFHPRYQLVFSMTSGLLAQNKKALQQFFEILYSSPKDLGKSRETILFARCFEECIDSAGKISQYEKFIQDVIEVLKDANILHKTKLDILNRNQCLLPNDKVINFLRDNLENPSLNFLYFLMKLDERKNRIPKEIFTEKAQEKINALLSKSSPYVRQKVEKFLKKILDGWITPSSKSSDNVAMGSQAAEALGEIAKAGGALSEKELDGWITPSSKSSDNVATGSQAAEALEEIVAAEPFSEQTLDRLIALLSDPSASYFMRIQAAETLGKISKAEGPFSEKILDRLIASDPSASFYMSPPLARALEEIVKAGGPFSAKTLNRLIAWLLSPSTDIITRSQAAISLGEIGKAGQFFSEQALDGLIKFLSDREIADFARGSAADALGKIAKADRPFSKEALEGLIAFFSKLNFRLDLGTRVAKALEEIAKARGAFSEKALGGLITVFSNEKLLDIMREKISPILKQAVIEKITDSYSNIKLICRICGMAFYEIDQYYYVADERKVYPLGRGVAKAL